MVQFTPAPTPQPEAPEIPDVDASGVVLSEQLQQVAAAGEGGGFGMPPGVAQAGLPGLQTPLPTAPPEAAQLMRLEAQNQPMSRNVTVNIESIVVDTQATDAREIAQNISAELRDQINVAEESADSNIAM